MRRRPPSTALTLNLVGLADDHAKAPAPDSAALRRRMRDYEAVIDAQRQQMARLALRLHNVECQLNQAPPASSAPDVAVPSTSPSPEPIDTTASPVPSSRQRMAQELQEQKTLNRNLERRLQTLTDALMAARPAHTSRERSTRSPTGRRWLSGPGRQAGGDSATAREQMTGAIMPADLCTLIVSMSSRPDVRHVLREVCRILPHLVCCSKAIVYVIDQNTSRLTSLASNFLRPDAVLQVAIGRGITGHAATATESMRVINAARDKLYDVDADGHCRAMICTPIRDPYAQRTIGVIQLADKLSSTAFFTRADQALVEITAAFVALRLCNDALAQRALTDRNKLKGMFATAESLMSLNDMGGVVEQLAAKINDYCRADYTVIMAVDRDQQEMSAVGQCVREHMTLRIPAAYTVDRQDGSDPDAQRVSLCRATSMAAAAIGTNQRFVVDDASSDARFKPTFDEYLADVKTFGPTLSLLIHPVVHAVRERVVGLIVVGCTRSHAFSTDTNDGVVDYHELVCHTVMRLQASRSKTYALRTNLGVLDDLVERITFQQGAHPSTTFDQ